MQQPLNDAGEMRKATRNYVRNLFGHSAHTMDEKEMRRQAEHSPFEGCATFTPTPIDISLIRRSWSDDFDLLYTLGVDIYAFIFDAAPQARFLFPKVAEAGDKWRDLPCVRSQSLKFMQVVSEAVKNLGRPEYLSTYLQHIGQLHVRIAVEKGFHSDLWRVFRDAIYDTMKKRIESGVFDKRLSLAEREAALQAWTNLSVLIIQTMHEGYAKGIIEFYSHNGPIGST